jgi:dihydroflavonol-4-reductase
MKYFVTGGTGLVGQWVLSALVQAGAMVRASYRGAPPTSLPNGASAAAVEWLEGDVLDPLFLQHAVTGATVVIHAAAIVSYAPSDAERLWQTNVEGTANVVNALLSHAPTARLIHVSSVAALGPPAPGATKVDETAEWDPAAPHAAYAESKFAAELEVWRGLNEGLQGLLLNPSVVLGPGDPKRSSTQLFRYAAEEHLFYPPGALNVVDVRDVVAAILVAAIAPSDCLGARYVLSSEAISYADFFTQIATILGRRPPRRMLPKVLAEILWRIEAVRAKLTGAAPLLTRETARVGRRMTVFDSARAQAIFGLTFRSAIDSVTWVAQTLRAQGLGAV